VVDGGWWPHSRDAMTELPGIVAALDCRPGVRVQRAGRLARPEGVPLKTY
jgi:Family of unknown function (DUF5994)